MGQAAAPIATLAVQAIGTGVQVLGSMQQAKAAEKQSAYERAVARNNQILADRAAQDAIERGKAEESKKRMETRQLQGRQRAVLAANGVVVDQGSALDLTSDTAMLGEYDALTIRSNAEREALGYRQQGANYSAEADLARMRGKNAATAGYISAGSTFLSGVGTVASKWYDFKRQGAFS